MPVSREEVFQLIQKNQIKLRDLGVRQLQLFGSVVREEANSASDLDVLVELEENTFASYMDVKFFLEDLFESPVDLVLLDNIKPPLRKGILQEAVNAPGF